MSSIGARLKYCREKLRYLQKDIEAVTGISSKSISNWEQGRSFPSLTDLRTLANLYHVSTDFIIGDVNVYQDALKEQQESDFLKVLFKNDPEMKGLIKSVRLDGSVLDNDAIYHLSPENIAFIKNAIRLAIIEAKQKGQTDVEINP
ncbi:Transcriptional regulator, contains XRE-family HTH domain [Anaerovibrio lipolyticus DSM 3074]|uniref:Transcriptional regulator, contains XRE-family HTH domain n=1 Tax=Anaerovibrio lipolyticus DSM 3074 TaxID=1120997 RepID=A0A1M6C5E9_9FIRM|nr:helix-turn-helix transcriptional regulator [Anaerovibrio lipolyticus]SHI55958.1 Transcriptional regulator, contains XRE-family HTH domain [Anaerovibrio lipolyticus DSM 3074]